MVICIQFKARGESGRSRGKWTIQLDPKRRKVDGPQGMKVDGLNQQNMDGSKHEIGWS